MRGRGRSRHPPGCTSSLKLRIARDEGFGRCCATSWSVGVERTWVGPRIDHMSAMQVIDDIREQGGTTSGLRRIAGLVAPADDNPGTGSVGIPGTWWAGRVAQRRFWSKDGCVWFLHIAPSKVWCPSKWKDVRMMAIPIAIRSVTERPMGFKRWRPWFGERFGRLASANPGTSWCNWAWSETMRR